MSVQAPTGDPATDALIKDAAIEALIRNAGNVGAAVLDLTDHAEPTALETAAADLIDAVEDALEARAQR